jgi:hypothetical protein
MAKREQLSVGELTMCGIYQKVGTHSVYVLVRDASGHVFICAAAGANLPHDGDAGFAVGCIFVNLTAGTIYLNAGTVLAANFDLLGTVVGAGSITDAELAANSVITAKILAANVTLAKLAAGITPSHIVKYAGYSPAEVDADASVVIANAGFLDTDVGMAVYAAGANDVYVKKVVMAAGTMTVTLSGNGGAGTIVGYQVLRAAA